MESCYSCHPLLHLGKDVIHSCCGVQQGDPLGPPGFSLTLRPIVERIKAKVPSLALNAWYLDNGTLVGPPEGLSAALDIIERDGPSLGLHLNNGLQRLPHRHVEIPGCLLDVAQRGGAKDVYRRIWGRRDMNARGWSPSSPLSSSRPYMQLPPPLATPCRSAFSVN